MSHDIDPELEVLVEEWGAEGIGKRIYNEILSIIKAVVRGGHYPTMYSPIGIWNDEAFFTLANDFIVEKLQKRNYLAYLLQTNVTLQGFRKGGESVFKNFLISKKKRTVLDNLFRRANDILQRDNRFKCFISAKKKAQTQWGLSSWDTREAFNGREEELIRIALGLGSFTITEYNPEAKKISHILSDTELGDFIYSLFITIDSQLDLTQLISVFKYRFNLLEVTEVSLEKPVYTDEEDNILTTGDTLSSDELGTTSLEINEAAGSVLRLLSSRQKQVLMEFQEPKATLSSIGSRVGCSKSTVDNELRRIFTMLADVSDNHDEACDIYNKLTELIYGESN